jgi:hypothetical protein
MSKTPLRHIPLGEFGTEHETDAELITYIVVGRAVVTWGCLEQNFNFLVAKIYKKFGGSLPPPFALKRKIEFWNECFRKEETLKGMQEQALAFSRELLEAKKKRDTLLHFHFSPDKDAFKPLKGRSLRSTATGHVKEQLDLPLKAINGLVNDTNHLNLRLMPLAFSLLSGQPPKR